MKPVGIVYECGQDIHGRPVLLKLEQSYKGPSWTIWVLAANQRDDAQRIYGLPPEVILAMAEAVQASKKAGAA